MKGRYKLVVFFFSSTNFSRLTLLLSRVNERKEGADDYQAERNKEIREEARARGEITSFPRPVLSSPSREDDFLSL